ncbi:MAG: hypothetical protein WCG94_04710, partial [Methanothrix sp.]
MRRARAGARFARQTHGRGCRASGSRSLPSGRPSGLAAPLVKHGQACLTGTQGQEAVGLEEPGE